MTESPDLYAHYRDSSARDAIWHQHGRRAPGESVYADGVDITDTVHPDRWPEGPRRYFYELGWRPWTPPDVTPVWWSATDEREPTASPGQLATAKGIAIADLSGPRPRHRKRGR